MCQTEFIKKKKKKRIGDVFSVRLVFGIDSHCFLMSSSAGKGEGIESSFFDQYPGNESICVYNN